jgi:alpha-L-arabinofuranosidase
VDGGSGAAAGALHGRGCRRGRDLLLSLLRHADRVAVGCQAQLVNVLAPIVALPDEPAWRQTIFRPFAQAAAYARGTVLRLAVDARRHDTEEHGEVETLSAVATYDESRQEVALFMGSRDPVETMDVSVDLRSLVRYPSKGRVGGAARSPRPQPVTGTTLDDDHVLDACLPAVSWNVIRITLGC